MSSVQQLKIVHSSIGRLRVHLPDPAGRISSRLRGLPGVTYAEGSKWTDNLLILFNPRQITAEAVLQAIGADTPPPSVSPSLGTIVLVEKELASPGESATTVALVEPSAEAATVVAATGLRRRIYVFLGWASVVMAIVGFLLPGIPGVPFVILAGYFFSRSSPELHAWLMRSRLFGPILRAARGKTKASAPVSA